MKVHQQRRPSRPAKDNGDITLGISLGRNQFGYSATVHDHLGTWSAHATSPETAVVTAAWKVVFRPEFVRRPTWEMWMATKVQESADGLWLVTIPATNLANLRPLML